MDTEAAAGSDWAGNSKSSDTISFYFLRSPFLLCHSPALSDDQAFTVSDSAILQFAELCLCRKKNCQNWLAIRTIVHSQILLLSILSIYFSSDIWNCKSLISPWSGHLRDFWVWALGQQQTSHSPIIGNSFARTNWKYLGLFEKYLSVSPPLHFKVCTIISFLWKLVDFCLGFLPLLEYLTVVGSLPFEFWRLGLKVC